MKEESPEFPTEAVKETVNAPTIKQTAIGASMVVGICTLGAIIYISRENRESEPDTQVEVKEGQEVVVE